MNFHGFESSVVERRYPEENERGWTVRLTVGDEVVLYCPVCDERELGQP